VHTHLDLKVSFGPPSPRLFGPPSPRLVGSGARTLISGLLQPETGLQARARAGPCFPPSDAVLALNAAAPRS
jgi:hypothetical protein